MYRPDRHHRGRFMPIWFTALLVLCAGFAAAQTAPRPEGFERIGLIQGWSEADGARISAIEIRLATGWHTYWRAPGATGFPPQFDWSRSENLAEVAYDWPRPQVFVAYGAKTIGYKDALVLPVRLTPLRADAPLDVSLDIFLGVCREICIPAQAHLALRIRPDAAPEGRAKIEAALAKRPLDAREGGVLDARCDLNATGESFQLVAQVTLDGAPAPDVTTVIEAETRPDLWIGAADTRTSGHSVHATARLDALGDGGAALDQDALRVTLLDERRAIDIRGCARSD
jgi:DsbC/DsbD-like thiol-disulfide interchange protein